MGGGGGCEGLFWLARQRFARPGPLQCLGLGFSEDGFVRHPVAGWPQARKIDMGDKGKKDKGKREQHKQAQRTPEEKRKLKKEKKAERKNK